MIYYFAYGSNLHPGRLLERIPSAELVGVAKHPHHTLTFDKKSGDGSSKCNMFNSGSNLVYGAIYKLNPDHKDILDRFEGKGYFDDTITLEYNTNKYSCFTYFAQKTHIAKHLKPYHWYIKLVILGAKYLQFPDAYISTIEAVKSIEDPDMIRRKERNALIERVINYKEQGVGSNAKHITL